MVKFFSILAFLITAINFNINSRENINLIAHAGGEIDGFIYTNSLEAIKQSINLGYNFIEIDLHLTSDGFFFGFHDFDNLVLKNIDDAEYLENFKKKFYSQSINKNDLLIINQKLKYPLILEEDIIKIFKLHNKLNLVTDKTQDFNELESKFKFMKNRLYIEISTKKIIYFLYFMHFKIKYF